LLAGDPSLFAKRDRDAFLGEIEGSADADDAASNDDDVGAEGAPMKSPGARRRSWTTCGMRATGRATLSIDDGLSRVAFVASGILAPSRRLRP
jgi:hypothetical protein